MKFGFKYLKKPTPGKMKKIGKALIAVNGFLATFTMIAGLSYYIAIGALATGAVGYFFTELFGDENAGSAK